MPMKLLKTETENELTVERILHAKRYSLTLDKTRCTGCGICKEICLREAIEIRKVPKANGEKANLTVAVDIEEDLCSCCRLCEMKCPKDAIRVRKIFHGTLRINREKCLEGCQDCLDVCPITGALYLLEDGKVYVNELYCVYCGVCKIVCPEEELRAKGSSKAQESVGKRFAWGRMT